MTRAAQLLPGADESAVKLIPLLGGEHFAAVDEADYAEISRHEWKPYFRRLKSRTIVYAIRYEYDPAVQGGREIRMHRVIAGAARGQLVDHRNGHGLDNRRANLRVCTASQNNANRQSCRNRFGHLGISKYTARGVAKPWRGVVQWQGKKYWTQSFASLEEAVQARKLLAKQYFGDFASAQDNQS